MKEVIEPKLCGECGAIHRPGENTCCPGWRPGPFVPDPPAEVQRYDEGQCGPSNMFPQPGGDWVKAEYFDAQKDELNEHRAESVRLRQELKQAEDDRTVLQKTVAEQRVRLLNVATGLHRCTADERAVLDRMTQVPPADLDRIAWVSDILHEVARAELARRQGKP